MLAHLKKNKTFPKFETMTYFLSCLLRRVKSRDASASKKNPVSCPLKHRKKHPQKVSRVCWCWSYTWCWGWSDCWTRCPLSWLPGTGSPPLSADPPTKLSQHWKGSFFVVDQDHLLQNQWLCAHHNACPLVLGQFSALKCKALVMYNPFEEYTGVWGV